MDVRETNASLLFVREGDSGSNISTALKGRKRPLNVWMPCDSVSGQWPVCNSFPHGCRATGVYDVVPVRDTGVVLCAGRTGAV